LPRRRKTLAEEKDRRVGRLPAVAHQVRSGLARRQGGCGTPVVFTPASASAMSIAAASRTHLSLLVLAGVRLRSVGGCGDWRLVPEGSGPPRLEGSAAA
jgi:hypothetical protein